MSHLNTWPNIYGDDCYLKLDWDFENLEKIGDSLLKEKIVFECIKKSRN